MGRYVYPDSYLAIVKRFVLETGIKCFSYRIIRAWFLKKSEYRDLDYHTFERRLRDLAQEHIIKRVRYGRKVLFCVDEDKLRYW